MNFSMVSVKQFEMECDLKWKSYGNRAEYNAELEKIVKYLNKCIGSSWRMVKQRKKEVKWQGMGILPSQLPWNCINTAIKDFDRYFNNSSSFFLIDHTFPRGVSIPLASSSIYHNQF